MTGFKDRIIRAAKLDVNLYEEVEADKGAMSQATYSSRDRKHGKSRAYRAFIRDGHGPYRVVYLGLSHLLYWDESRSR